MAEEMTYKIILASFVMPILLSMFLIWFFWRFQKQKHRHELDRRDQILKQQALIIEKQEAVEYERNRIASEMHDDLGSGLTTIKYLSDQAMRSATDEKGKGKIDRIAHHAQNLIHNMSEIIWAMNSRFDTATDLVGYIRRYASEYLDEHNKKLKFSVKGVSHTRNISGEKRRNLFLVTKELLHNFVKYADSDELSIEISLVNDTLRFVFLEHGNQAFDPGKAEDQGNGLINMTKRMKEIGGTFNQQLTDDG